MDKRRLLELLTHPTAISPTEVAELISLSQEFPYFQAVFALRAKATQRTEDIQKAAVRTTHRSFLQKLMNNSQFNPNYQLPDLKELDIHPHQVNAFETLSHIDTSPYQEQETIPHHLVVNVSDGERNEQIEVEITLPEENNEKDTDLLFEQEDKSEAVETYFHLAENPSKIEELAFQKAEENLAKSDKKEIVEESQGTPGSDEESLRDYLQKAMEEIRQIKSMAMQKSEEIAAQSHAVSEPTVAAESAQENATLEAVKPAAPTENFVEPDYKIDYSYDEVDKFPYLEENSDTSQPQENMPLFKESEIQELQKMVQAIQTGSQTKETVSEEKELLPPQEEEPQEAAVAYESANFSLNPDFFELHQIIANQESTPNKKIQTSQTTYTPPLAWEKQKGIIDRFIAIEPQLKIKVPEEADQEVEQENLAQISEISRFQASENLAMILKRQGKFERAIQIYEDLLLKYPEKRTYFAEQIEKIKKELRQ